MKVGSMTTGKRILLVTTVLLLATSGLEAGLWKSRKAQTAVDAPQATAGMSLSAVEVEPSRVVLRTSGTPAYTSYSPSPDVFVVDLTGTSRPADLTIPAALPPSLATLAAEEVTEMGSRLTRVTFRFAVPTSALVTPLANGVAVSLPAPIASPLVETVTPVAELEVPRAVAVEEPVPTVSEPAVVAELIPVPANKARNLRAVSTAGKGTDLQIEIAGDGAMAWKAFRLDNPSRLVIDVTGVRNQVARQTLDVNDSLVQRVRVAQFQSTPEPIARVVVDLGAKTEYAVVPSGQTLRVAFGPQAATRVASALPAPLKTASVNVPKAEPGPEPVKVATATDIPSEVPVIAEESRWKMPAPSKAKQVINAPVDQAAPSAPRLSTNTSTPTENVFDDAALAVQPAQAAGRTLSGTQRVFTGDPISLNLKDADIKDVLRTFAQLTQLNIAVDPQVGGTVTVDFVDVPWDQALDLILRQNGLTFILEGNVMRVGTIDRLAQETAAQRKLADEERLSVATTTLSFKLSYAKASEVSALLKDIASPRARIIMDQRTNQLIISEIPQYLQTMRNLIETVDIPNRQVTIEARIVETTKSFNLQYGFSWGFNGNLDPALGTGTGLIFPNRIDYTGGPFSFTGGGLPILGLTMTDVLGAFDLDLALHAAETENMVKVVSAPKVTTQDNQAAEIQSGVQIPYQTRVNFTTTVSYIDATLRLSVTPQITEAGTIIMDIAVQKTTPGQPIEGAAGTPLNTRQARTRVMVRDGGTAVIGGIYQASDTSSQSRVPILGQIPILGALFRSNSNNTQHDELLIFITPRIVRGS